LLAGCAAIVENGSGILEPGASIAQPAPSHERLLSLVERLPADLRGPFSGFSSWDPGTLQGYTGLSDAGLAAAARRDYTEPGLWRGDARQKRDFIDQLDKLGIRVQQGGRFLTLGFGADKADRMQTLVESLRERQSLPVASIALGDAPNDVEMLQRADYGIIVPNPAHAGIAPLAGESQGRIMRASKAGPAGWNQSLLALLNQQAFAWQEK
jgi:mannosyl-3-phosphoglycerate phosphatase